MKKLLGVIILTCSMTHFVLPTKNKKKKTFSKKHTKKKPFALKKTITQQDSPLSPFHLVDQETCSPISTPDNIERKIYVLQKKLDLAQKKHSQIIEDVKKHEQLADKIHAAIKEKQRSRGPQHLKRCACGLLIKPSCEMCSTDSCDSSSSE